jgi:DHA3 family macrolide efflux protein-like MFS transporter
VLATASLAAVLPNALMFPFAGALVDRWNRRWVIVLSDAWSALVALALAILFWTNLMQLWHVYFVILLSSIGGAFHGTAFFAVTPALVPERHLARIAGLGTASEGMLNVLGPMLGALAISILPLHGVMLIDVVTAAFAIAPFLFIRLPATTKGSQEKGCGIFASIREGLDYVRSVRGLVLFLGAFALTNFISNPAYRLMPLLVTQHFGEGAFGYASLSSAWGIGIIVGGLVISVWGGFRRRITTVILGAILQGLGTTLVGAAPSWAILLAVFGMGFAGLGNSMTNAPLSAIFQSGVPDHLRGRFYAVLGTIMMLAQPFGFALAGPVADIIGIRAWILWVGILQVAIISGLLLFPSVRRIEEMFKLAAMSGQSISNGSEPSASPNNDS